ncbi:hypothetical protein BC829DRAFT_61558 [Chytridium lagenaria]|nr:hypothetical protein BC829DRAFT_61558 [Chytridium lagenaria]
MSVGMAGLPSPPVARRFNMTLQPSSSLFANDHRFVQQTIQHLPGASQILGGSQDTSQPSKKMRIGEEDVYGGRHVDAGTDQPVPPASLFTSVTNTVLTQAPTQFLPATLASSSLSLATNMLSSAPLYSNSSLSPAHSPPHTPDYPGSYSSSTSMPFILQQPLNNSTGYLPHTASPLSHTESHRINSAVASLDIDRSSNMINHYISTSLAPLSFAYPPFSNHNSPMIPQTSYPQHIPFNTYSPPSVPPSFSSPPPRLNFSPLDYVIDQFGIPGVDYNVLPTWAPSTNFSTHYASCTSAIHSNFEQHVTPLSTDEIIGVLLSSGVALKRGPTGYLQRIQRSSKRLRFPHKRLPYAQKPPSQLQLPPQHFLPQPHPPNVNSTTKSSATANSAQRLLQPCYSTETATSFQSPTSSTFSASHVNM